VQCRGAAAGVAAACTGDAASSRNLAVQRACASMAWIARSARVAVPWSAAGLLIAGFNAVKDMAAHPGHTAALEMLVWRALQAWPTG
jgi:hypothetical protein